MGVAGLLPANAYVVPHRRTPARPYHVHPKPSWPDQSTAMQLIALTALKAANMRVT